MEKSLIRAVGKYFGKTIYIKGEINVDSVYISKYYAKKLWDTESYTFFDSEGNELYPIWE